MAVRAAQVADRRVPLSKERVLRAAMDFADREGIEALSMRKLAQELGVEAMSLYYYVANKDDLFDGIADIVVGEFDLSPDAADWKSAIRRSAISAHAVLRRHPWAAALILSRKTPSLPRLRYMESLLARLGEAGLSPGVTDHAYHVVESHVMGFALWIAGLRLDKVDLAKMARRFIHEIPASEYPSVHEHIKFHAAPARDGVSAFEFGLDLILDGLEKMRRSAPRRRGAKRPSRRRS